ncbi:MAG: WecB/TagA/CpsF family glycosyltransferase [Lacibacter sp.]|jgi:N-acetylglucosaminyldiphosphoundecaprenol N-acetyl-beta-D-mannosaminyltransferase
MAKEETIKVISLYPHAMRFTEAMQWVVNAGINKMPGFVCFANVHMTVEACKDPLFAQQLRTASLVLADGQPIAKAMRWFSGKPQERIAGMDFLPSFLKYLNERKIALRIFLLGGEEAILSAMQERIRNEFPFVQLAGIYAPPFGNWGEEENNTIIRRIHDAEAQVVFVAFGCPRQEKWMANNTGAINAVLLGVGGAFSVFSGKQSRAPVWMQRSGLEWLYRLQQEPGRLIKRYITTNSLFILLLLKQLIQSKIGFDKQQYHKDAK